MRRLLNLKNEKTHTEEAPITEGAKVKHVVPPPVPQEKRDDPAPDRSHPDEPEESTDKSTSQSSTDTQAK